MLEYIWVLVQALVHFMFSCLTCTMGYEVLQGRRMHGARKWNFLDFWFINIVPLFNTVYNESPLSINMIQWSWQSENLWKLLKKLKHWKLLFLFAPSQRHQQTTGGCWMMSSFYTTAKHLIVQSINVKPPTNMGPFCPMQTSWSWVGNTVFMSQFEMWDFGVSHSDFADWCVIKSELMLAYAH